MTGCLELPDATPAAVSRDLDRCLQPRRPHHNPPKPDSPPPPPGLLLPPVSRFYKHVLVSFLELMVHHYILYTIQ